MRHLVTLAAALLAVAAPAQAFASIQRGDSPHDEITAVAAEAGWPEDAVKALQAAVRQPDIDDLEPAPTQDDKQRLDVSVTFRPWHHCVRVAPSTDAEAVNATIQYVAHERDLAHKLALVDPAASVRALGRALHALQDCFSHSNAVDLPPETQQALADALVQTGKAPALLVCGVQPGAPDIDQPPGDAYTHADFNKDDPSASPEAEALLDDGRSKHEHALAAATDATRAFLVDFMQRLEPPESERLLAVEVDSDGKGGAAGIPAPAAVVPLAALAVAALVRSRAGGRRRQ